MAGIPQGPVRRRGRGRVLRLDDGDIRHCHRLAAVDGRGQVGRAQGLRGPGDSGAPRAAPRCQAPPGQGRVDGGPGLGARQVQGGALIGGGQHRPQRGGNIPGRGRAGDPRARQTGGHEGAARAGQAGGVVGVVAHAPLDGGAARAAGLDLQEAQAGIQVGAGAHLEAPTPLAGRENEGLQPRGVEVGRGVGEAAPPVDVQDPGLGGEAAHELLRALQRHQVLAVHPGEQARGVVELGETGCGQVLCVQGARRRSQRPRGGDCPGGAHGCR